jgi:hypothetical protein
MKTTKKLPTQLSEEELRERGDALAESVEKTAALAEEKKAQDAEINGKIKLSKEITRKLSRIIASKTEDRDVECDVVKDYKAGTVTTFRSDTGEQVDQRTLTAEERQEELYQPKADRVPVKGKGKKPFGGKD